MIFYSLNGYTSCWCVRDYSLEKHLSQFNYMARYILVGGMTALGYLIVALFLVRYVELSVAMSGFVAFNMMLPIAYLGHKLHTFQSEGAHRQEFPRFVFTAVLGASLSALLPWLFTTIVKSEPVIGFSVACIAIPLINYVLLSGYVFVQAKEKSNE